MNYTLDELRNDLSQEFGGGHCAATAKQHYKGAKGGDGGAAARQAAEDARIAAAVQRINEIFGLSDAKPESVNRANFTSEVAVNNNNSSIGRIGFGDGINNSGFGLNQLNANNNQQTQKVFDENGYNASVAASKEKADLLKGAAGKREALYSTIGTDTTNNLLTDLFKERDTANRELRFGLARQGLSGGSRDIDASRELLDTTNQGILKATNFGKQAANNARFADDNSRTDIISRIRGGLDQENAIQQSGELQRNNAARARDESNAQSLTGFFNTIRNEYDRVQYNQGLQQANKQFSYGKKTGSTPFNGSQTREY